MITNPFYNFIVCVTLKLSESTFSNVEPVEVSFDRLLCRSEMRKSGIFAPYVSCHLETYGRGKRLVLIFEILLTESVDVEETNLFHFFTPFQWTKIGAGISPDPCVWCQTTSIAVRLFPALVLVDENLS